MALCQIHCTTFIYRKKKLAKIWNSICWTKLVENKKQNRKRIIDTVHGIGNPPPSETILSRHDPFSIDTSLVGAFWVEFMEAR